MGKRTIYSRFKEMAERYPDQPAIITDMEKISYRELDTLVDSILSRFYDSVYKFIGIVTAHGIHQIAAMLAVLKSGAAYVPAEPSLPGKRIDYMMTSLGVELIITDDFFEDLQPARKPLTDHSKPDSPAYVLFTSGTTGRPKGVIVENHSVVNYSEAFEEEFSTGPGDVMLQYSVCSFDIFVEEVFTTLLNGATLCIPPRDIHDKPVRELLDFVHRQGVTIIDGFPYLIADINKEGSVPASVKLIISGGDVIREAYITNLKGKGVKIYNTYGPSETTVCSNYYRVDNATALPDGTYPVGRAVKGVETRILDDRLQEVPDGETGEICIFGEGVSRGYAGNPPEQANFVTMPDGRRMYRSGDLGYRLPDGNVAFLHRKDNQVMIYGKRVEPSEVENVLNSMPGIAEAVVKAFKDDDGLHYLIAYFVENEDLKANDIRGYLASRLSDFMVPSYFVRLTHIPMNSHGKVDVSSLPIVLKL